LQIDPKDAAKLKGASKLLRSPAAPLFIMLAVGAAFLLLLAALHPSDKHGRISSTQEWQQQMYAEQQSGEPQQSPEAQQQMMNQQAMSQGTLPGIGIQNMASLPGAPGVRMRPGAMRVYSQQGGGMAQPSGEQLQMQQEQQRMMQQQMLQQQLGAVFSSGGNPFGTARSEEGDAAQSGDGEQASQDNAESSGSDPSGEQSGERSGDQSSGQGWSLPFMSMFQQAPASGGMGAGQQSGEQGYGEGGMASAPAPSPANGGMSQQQANFGAPQQSYGAPQQSYGMPSAPAPSSAYNMLPPPGYGFGGAPQPAAPTGLGRYASEYSSAGNGYGMMPMPASPDRPFAHHTVVSR